MVKMCLSLRKKCSCTSRTTTTKNLVNFFLKLTVQKYGAIFDLCRRISSLSVEYFSKDFVYIFTTILRIIVPYTGSTLRKIVFFVFSNIRMQITFEYMKDISNTVNIRECVEVLSLRCSFLRNLVIM